MDRVLPLLGLFVFAALATQVAREHLPSASIALAVKAAVWLIPAALYARESMAETFAVRAPARTGLRRAAIVGVAYLCAVFLLTLAASGGALVFRAPSMVALALLVGNVFVEEAALRGFLLLRLARLLRFWKANVLVAIGFAALHVPWFLSQGMNAVEIVVSGVVLIVLSLALGEATRATRSIWPAVVIHLLNNLLG